MLSNDLRIDLNLAEEGTAPPPTTGESGGSEEVSPGLDSESEQASGPPEQTEQEESGLGEGEENEVGEGDTEDEEQDEGQQLPLPLFGGG